MKAERGLTRPSVRAELLGGPLAPALAHLLA